MATRKKDSMGQPTPDETIKLGLAWFRREQWNRLLSVSADRDDLEATFDEWFQTAQQRLVELKESGCDVEKVDIDVEELVPWCQARRMPIDGQARSRFALDKLRASS